MSQKQKHPATRIGFTFGAFAAIFAGAIVFLAGWITGKPIEEVGNVVMVLMLLCIGFGTIFGCLADWKPLHHWRPAIGPTIFYFWLVSTIGALVFLFINLITLIWLCFLAVFLWVSWLFLERRARKKLDAELE